MMVLVCICHGKDLDLVSYNEALFMDFKKENSLIIWHQTQINQIYGLSSMLSFSFPLCMRPICISAFFIHQETAVNRSWPHISQF